MRKDFFIKTELKERGWTDALIRDYLGNPDKEKKHSSYNSIIKFYRTDKVEKAESKEDFKKALEKSSERKKSAKKAVDTKLQKAQGLLNDLDYALKKKLKKDTLIKAALEHYNLQKGYHAAQRDGDYNPINSYKDFDGSEKEYDKFIERICVNYLRHDRSEYDLNLIQIDSELKGKVGVHKIKRMQRNKILDSIKEKYPWLADETERQKH